MKVLFWEGISVFPGNENNLNTEINMFKKTIDRMELIKQMRRMNRKKGKIIQPKTVYNRKDKSWKKQINST